MKLYSLSHSPFAMSVCIQIRHKNIPVDIVAPPETFKSPDFTAQYPLGKIPVLVLDGGISLGESTVIIDYLDAVFPANSMLPEDPLGRAQNGMLQRYTDSHLSSAMSPLFGVLMSVPGSDTGLLLKMDKLRAELDKLERLLSHLPDFKLRELQTGDICLVTTLFYAIELTKLYGDGPLIDHLPCVSAWWRWVNTFPAVAESIAELDVAYQVFLQKIQGVNM